MRQVIAALVAAGAVLGESAAASPPAAAVSPPTAAASPPLVGNTLYADAHDPTTTPSSPTVMRLKAERKTPKSASQKPAPSAARSPSVAADDAGDFNSLYDKLLSPEMQLQNKEMGFNAGEVALLRAEAANYEVSVLDDSVQCVLLCKLTPHLTAQTYSFCK